MRINRSDWIAWIRLDEFPWIGLIGSRPNQTQSLSQCPGRPSSTFSARPAGRPNPIYRMRRFRSRYADHFDSLTLWLHHSPIYPSIHRPFPRVGDAVTCYSRALWRSSWWALGTAWYFLFLLYYIIFFSLVIDLFVLLCLYFLFVSLFYLFLFFYFLSILV